MPTTPIYGLRYPLSSAPADVPTDMNNLATDVETTLSNKAVTSNDTRVANRVPTWNGSAWVYSPVTTAMMSMDATMRDALANLIIPPGTMMDYGGAAAPTGWLLCDGTAVSRTTYAALFAIIGTAYGVGNGTTTFNLPDFRGKVAAGRDAGQTEFATLGQAGGEKAHTLTVGEMPSHNHGGATGTGTTGTGTTGGGSTGTGTTGTDSPDHTHSGSTDAPGDHTHSTVIAYTLNFDNTHTGSGNVVTAIGAGSTNSSAQGSSAAGNHSHAVSVGGASARHAHSVPSLSIPGLSVPGLSIPALGITAQGGGTAANNLPPYQVVNKIIKT